MNRRVFNYESDLQIDPNALDVEWLQQPNLYMHYADEAARAREALDRAKEQLDVVRAKLDNVIRQHPAEYLGSETKVTNPAVEAAILLHEDYYAAQNEHQTRKLEADLLSSALRALDHRKAALENLVRLHATSYFAGPQEPRDLALEWGKRAELGIARDKVVNTMREKNNRRRRANGEETE